MVHFVKLSHCDFTVWKYVTFENYNMVLSLKLDLSSVYVKHYFGSITGHSNVTKLVTASGEWSSIEFFMHRDLPTDQLGNTIVKVIRSVC